MDKLTKERRSWNMSRIRSNNTSIEIAVRKNLYSKGYRYRLNYPLFGKPDLVFPNMKIAVFVNGCFWHSHGCKLSTMPSTNTEFWKKKLGSSKERDAVVERKLIAEGWIVERIWECEIENDLEQAVAPLIDLLDGGDNGIH